MVIRIRLARFGKKHSPFYNIVVAHARYAQFAILPRTLHTSPIASVTRTHLLAQLPPPKLSPKMRKTKKRNKETWIDGYKDTNAQTPAHHATGAPSKSWELTIRHPNRRAPATQKAGPGKTSSWI